MNNTLYRMRACTGAAVFVFSIQTWAADAPAASAHNTGPDISGTYELVKRVLPDGKEVLPPAIAGLYTLTHGRRNFNVFWIGKDGKTTSLSVISKYTLSGGKYCEKGVFWLQNNLLGKQGTSNEPPAGMKDCSPVTVQHGKLSFQPAGEPMLSFNKDGLTATAAGQFVDYWQKLR